MADKGIFDRHSAGAVRRRSRSLLTVMETITKSHQGKATRTTDDDDEVNRSRRTAFKRNGDFFFRRRSGHIKQAIEAIKHISIIP